MKHRPEMPPYPHPRLQLTAAGVLLAAAFLSLWSVPSLLAGMSPHWWESIVIALALMALGSLVGGIPLARRHAGTALAASLEMACLGAVTLAALALGILALGRWPDEVGNGFTLAVVMAAACGALLVGLPRAWLRARLWPTSGRRQSSLQDAVSAFSEHARRYDALAEPLGALADSLYRSLSLQSVQLWTGAGGRLTLAAAAGPGPHARWLQLSEANVNALTRSRVVGPGWLDLWVPTFTLGSERRQLRVVPASAADTLLGLLVVERHEDAARFSESEDRLLGELGIQFGLALHNRALDASLREALNNLQVVNADLRISRARLVAAGDAERRRIERDLHDGVQQELVSLAVGIRLVRELVTDDVTGTAATSDRASTIDETLESLADQVTNAIAHLRNLAHGIYPSLLMSVGLTEALRAADRLALVGLEVRGEDVGRHPPEIEAAVYFSCLEALQNAAKHAPGSSAVLSLTVHESTLIFEVADQGPGFDPSGPETRSGHGLMNISDRIGAIGGTVQWDSGPEKGTRVRGLIPLPEAAVTP